MKPSNNIGFLLQKIALSLARQNDDILQDALGIGFSQFKILMALQWRPNVQQKQIAEHLGQTEASISRQIKLMYDDGLLQATPRPEDRREHITTLTPRGQRVCDEALDVLNQSYMPMFRQLSKQDQDALLRSLTIMHDYLNLKSPKE